MRYVPYKYQPVDEESDHCQSSDVNYGEEKRVLRGLKIVERKDRAFKIRLLDK